MKISACALHSVHFNILTLDIEFKSIILPQDPLKEVTYDANAC